jgi:hypothetical protein
VAELAEVGEVFADLSVGEAEGFAELFGGDGSAVFALEGFELAQVEAQAADGGIGDEVGSGMLHEFLKATDSLSHCHHRFVLEKQISEPGDQMADGAEFNVVRRPMLP